MQQRQLKNESLQDKQYINSIPKLILGIVLIGILLSFVSASDQVFPLNVSITIPAQINITAPPTTTGTPAGWVIQYTNVTYIEGLQNVTLASLTASDTTWDFNRQSVIRVLAEDVNGNPVELTSLTAKLKNSTKQILIKVIRKNIGDYNVQFTITDDTITNPVIEIIGAQMSKVMVVDKSPEYEEYSGGFLTGMSVFGDAVSGAGGWAAKNTGIVFLGMVCVFMIALLIIITRVQKK